MEVAVSYGLPSGVSMAAGQARVRLAGARERPSVRYRGALRDPLAFREALGALHDVVVADLRWRPPATREQFRRWLTARLDREADAERARLSPARRRFLTFAWDRERGAGDVLDPVVSVHPDRLLFEAFSRDGSTYARVGVDRAALDEEGEVTCGTTSVDFSAGLYESFRRLRSIWRTELELGTEPEAPEAGPGLAVATEGRTHTEKRIEVPDGWVRGFLQLGAAGLLDAVEVVLLPVHLYDLCHHLRLRRARVSPRALRWVLEPGQPVEAVLEPWETRLRLEGSTHTATERRVIRVWGRRRLLLAERAIPLAERVTVRLLGRGMPWFVTAQGADLDVTLGLSGWTRADWTRTASFDALIARRAGAAPSPKPLAWLERHHLGRPDEVARATDLDAAAVHAALVDAAARGQAVYDPLAGVYRHRPLLADLPAQLAPGHDPREAEARQLVARGGVTITGSRREAGGATRVEARVEEGGARSRVVRVALGEQGEVQRATCDCWFAAQRGLEEGLCPHQHALLLAWERP